MGAWCCLSWCNILFELGTLPLARSPQCKQSFINEPVERIHQADIRTTINARLKMAIADLMHCENLPNHVVDLPRFWLVLQHVRFIACSFKIPSSKQLGMNCWTSTTKTALKWTKRWLWLMSPYLVCLGWVIGHNARSILLPCILTF